MPRKHTPEAFERRRREQAKKQKRREKLARKQRRTKDDAHGQDGSDSEGNAGGDTPQTDDSADKELMD